MSKMWFSVIFLILIHQVVVSYCDCSNFDNIKNCNECIRCGGKWCNDPAFQYPRCNEKSPDSWCPRHQEELLFKTDNEIAGEYFQPRYKLQTSTSIQTADFEIKYTSSKNEEPVVKLVNSTQTKNILLDYRTVCENDACVTYISTKPKKTFCHSNGTSEEYYVLEMTSDSATEKAVMEVYVQCACRCSENTKERSPCNGNGLLQCGECNCDDGWTGKTCKCKKSRGDIGDILCSNPSKPGIPCSGNGYCGECDTCVCYSDRKGSRYFDENYYCEDICMKINNCDDDCLKDGRCENCLGLQVHRSLYNQTVLNTRDEKNRSIWIECSTSIDNCSIEYAAMRNANGSYNYMILKNCDPTQEGQVAGAVNGKEGGELHIKTSSLWIIPSLTSLTPPQTQPSIPPIQVSANIQDKEIAQREDVTLPLVLGILAAVAVLAAAGGYVFWKNRTPPVPMKDSMYQNIGAEDCTGENPLYKPPTSSFKNPTYGKW